MVILTGAGGRPRRLVVSPPFAFEGATGMGRPVEPIELGHVGRREDEIEHLRVFLDPIAMGRLRKHNQIVLKAPTQ